MDADINESKANNNAANIGLSMISKNSIDKYEGEEEDKEDEESFLLPP